MKILHLQIETLFHPDLTQRLKQGKIAQINGIFRHFWATKVPNFFDTYRQMLTKKLMFKIPVGCDFMLARYAGQHELHFSIEYCTVLSDAWHQKFKDVKICLILGKLFCFCRIPIEVRLMQESSFRIRNKIRMWRKVYFVSEDL